MLRFKSIDCIEANELISTGETVVIDVRDQEAYEAGHIHGAIRMSVGDLDEFCQMTSKERAILVYCYHGISSQSVAQYLVDQGMQNVYSLTGGFEVWQMRRNTAGDS